MNGSIFATDSNRTIGLVLCVVGWRDVMIGGLFYHIHPGVLCIKSPVARIQVWKHPCLILDESRQELFHDYRCRILEKRMALAAVISDEEGALIKNLIRLITQTAILEFAHIYFLDSEISPETMNRDMVVVASVVLFSLRLR